MINGLTAIEKMSIDEQLLIINSIIYTDDFINENISKEFIEKSVLYWANQFDVNTIDYTQDLPGEMNKGEIQNIINTIKANPEIYGEMIFKDIDNSQSATTVEGKPNKVVNVTIQKGDGSLIVAFKGTAGAIEWRDNGVGGYSDITDTKQQELALAYYDKMVELYGDLAEDIYVTGHSKGGNKAQYIGILRGEQEKLKHVYAFDGQGFGLGFFSKYKELIEKNKNKITNISNEYDFVNILFFSVAGERIFIKNSSNHGDELDFGSMLFHKLGGFHSPYSMFKEYKDDNGNKIIGLNKQVTQNETMKELEKLLQHYMKYMNEDDWRYFIYNAINLFMDGEEYDYVGKYDVMPEGFVERLLGLTKGYLQKEKGFDNITIDKLLNKYLNLYGLGYSNVPIITGLFRGIINISINNSVNNFILNNIYKSMEGESYSSVTRDFSDEAKQNLLSIITEVEEEAWYDITKWDLWYRVEKFFGGVDFPANQYELNEYYRKMIDMEGTSKAEIERIFTEVRELDVNFAKELSDIRDNIKKVNSSLDSVIEKFKVF